ncbi:hypothetical protein [uncultured Psychrobacter sp.]|uniref:hypothetical protein n=1 Tax=uncultured Psychrobacter sp. TaxID=259303 RepID=UPI0026078083|nr:hypothetical protein [uncultured Psychrobacter sp.]
MENSNCIIITHKEWLNWLAFGYLRVSTSRISYFDGSESSFEILMSYSVDNALDEEDAYLLASLVDEYSSKDLHVKRTPFSDYITIQAVQGFYSLSIKGRDLLEYEAEQSHSILNDDSKIENLWSEWKNNQLKLRSHDKGNKFLEILGYPRFEVEPELDNNTLFSKLLKNYNRRELPQELQKHNKKNVFSWLVSNYKFSEVVDKSIYNQYKKWRNSSELSAIYNEKMSKYLATDDECLVEQHSLIAEKIFFEGMYEQKDYLLATSFLVHYYNLLDNGYEINLQFLKTDLAFLGEVYPENNIPQRIAYFIGKRLNEVYLSHLYIAKNIDQKKPGMFDPNFFSNLKNKELTLCNIDQAQLQNIISKVNLTAEEIQLAYSKEANNEQESELGSDAIGERDGDSNQPTQSQKPMKDNDNIKTNNIPPTEELDTPSNTTNDDSIQPLSDAEKLVDSEESEYITNKIATKNKDFNEHNDNPEFSLNTQFNPSEKENPINSSDKIKTIESAINSESNDNNNLEQPEQPDSDHYMDLALSIYSNLTTNINEKNTGGNFIKKFIEHIDDSDKNKFKPSPQGAFFEHFGELIGDIETYKNINYSDFKNILDEKIQLASEIQNKLL